MGSGGMEKARQVDRFLLRRARSDGGFQYLNRRDSGSEEQIDGPHGEQSLLHYPDHNEKDTDNNHERVSILISSSTSSSIPSLLYPSFYRVVSFAIN